MCVPVDPDAQGKSQRRSIAIRTFLTSDFMTGVPVTPDNEVHCVWLCLSVPACLWRSPAPLPWSAQLTAPLPVLPPQLLPLIDEDDRSAADIVAVTLRELVAAKERWGAQ